MFSQLEILKQINFDANKYMEEGREILRKPTPKEHIKQREGGGGVMLDYVEGSYVIRVLNKAFKNMWDWDLVHFEIVQSQPKKITKKWNQKTRKMEALPEPIIEEQPPVAHVIGRLTVPGFGSRVGFGSKTVIGGASEQESCLKAASTDALKKAATLFGIALDLYEEIPVEFEEAEEEEEEVDESFKSTRGDASKFTQKQEEPEVEEQDEEEDTDDAEEGEWDPNDLFTLQKYMKELDFGNDRDKLNPYVKDFSDGDLDTWEDLTPQNIKPFLIYLERVIK